MVEIIAITKGMIDEATELMQNYGHCKNNDSVLGDKGAFYGQLGEVVFSEYLLNHKIGHLTQKGFQTERPTDDYDFKVGDKTIDVKTITGDPHDKHLVVKKSKFDNGYRSDYYVAISIDEKCSLAFICGWLSKEDVKMLPAKSFVLYNYYARLTELREIHDLIKVLK